MILVGVQGSVLYSLIALPVTVAAPTGIYFAQLAIIIITGLFTYNFIYTEDRPKRLIKAFVNNFKNTNHEKSNEDNAEAAGKLLGEMASKYMQQTPVKKVRVKVIPVKGHQARKYQARKYRHYKVALIKSVTSE